MSSGGKCRECGAVLPAGGPAGLCAKCLLSLGIEQLPDLADATSSDFDSQSTPPQGVGTVPTTSIASEKPGDEIGGFTLLKEIGHGGFGVVYLAEQKAPVKRRVALKILKLGMDTKEVV